MKVESDEYRLDCNSWDDIYGIPPAIVENKFDVTVYPFDSKVAIGTYKLLVYT
jgi:hypothetical protein